MALRLVACYHDMAPLGVDHAALDMSCETGALQSTAAHVGQADPWEEVDDVEAHP